ncbi:MAG: TraR/DksA family transcriptional regulator [Gammaproteobacteria bacterium]|nr:TraR/DksA family transcriptional regulator [Gammaproteobacteria bacterium]
MSGTTNAQRLYGLRDDLTARLARVHAHDEHRVEPVSQDYSEQAVERQNDEVVEALGVRLRGELAAIDAALARVAAGTYDECADCGEPIGAERREVLPLTAVCAACAARK